MTAYMLKFDPTIVAKLNNYVDVAFHGQPSSRVLSGLMARSDQYEMWSLHWIPCLIFPRFADIALPRTMAHDEPQERQLAMSNGVSNDMFVRAYLIPLRL